MSRTPAPLEVELAATNLRRDEQARNALTSRPRWLYGLVTLLTIVLVQALLEWWKELPRHAGVALAVVVGAVVALGLELYVARRRIDAVIRLLRLPSDA